MLYGGAMVFSCEYMLFTVCKQQINYQLLVEVEQNIVIFQWRADQLFYDADQLFDYIRSLQFIYFFRGSLNIRSQSTKSLAFATYRVCRTF